VQEGLFSPRNADHKKTVGRRSISSSRGYICVSSDSGSSTIVLFLLIVVPAKSTISEYSGK
jgi:hypothetical protein